LTIIQEALEVKFSSRLPLGVSQALGVVLRKVEALSLDVVYVMGMYQDTLVSVELLRTNLCWN